VSGDSNSSAAASSHDREGEQHRALAALWRGTEKVTDDAARAYAEDTTARQGDRHHRAQSVASSVPLNPWTAAIAPLRSATHPVAATP
jgi:hypothetical protein